MHIFKDHYENVDFLKNQSHSFLGWVMPLLTQEYVPAEQYLYYETDIITDIYFMTHGVAGFVLPFRKNIVYIELNKGDCFGEIDFAISAEQSNMTVKGMFESLAVSSKPLHPIRHFTVQAVENSTLLAISILNL
jgi:CRP-like cAMP-binding protein